ncbi:ribbon-helix-helix domain-containing protein [Nitratiruptor tergarcus]|uniref:Ribbon-helix-helix protein, copG family n=1 Tax=Nitratiruptor tergarcus DSM 16512 TaxID=1069081 RepID=A0A1W1WRE4_9BACT|nr:ribbon-helix-helix domain-containing protein [Nitratiruptor tergarcus]SMC08570.1 Ribbon-helix-helix protein, copG family [Nitratiruptor tergarcus DSM 16512]
MKTITLKTDEKLFEEITNLSRKLKLSKSELIRRAIKEYEKKIALQNIKRQIQQASLNIRKESANMIEDLENTIDDGLENV